MINFAMWPATLVTMALLIILSIIDIKTFNKKGAAIPAVLTTLLIIINFFLSGFNVFALVTAGLIGLLLFDLKDFAGISDYKVLVGTALAFPSLLFVCIFFVTHTMVGLLYKLLFQRYAFYGSNKLVPYIPAMGISFLIVTIVRIVSA